MNQHLAIGIAIGMFIMSIAFALTPRHVTIDKPVEVMLKIEVPEVLCETTLCEEQHD